MTLDSRIQSVLNREASTDEAPWPPPLDALRAAGEIEVRRRRVRGRLVAALVAFVVVALPAGIFLSGRTDSTGAPPERSPVARTPGLTLEELPVGAPPASLYCLDGVAHWGKQELPLADGGCNWPHRFAEADGSAVVVDSPRSIVNLFTDRGREQLPGRADSQASPVVFSPDGATVAWVSARVDGRQEIVLWDTARGVELKRAQAPTSDQLNVEGIDGSGRVYMTSVGAGTQALADRIWIWASRHDEGFRRVVGLGDFVSVADVPPDGLSVLKTWETEKLPAGGPGAVGLAVSGTVTARGKFVLGEAATVQPVVWSPDRSRYVAVDSLTVVSATGHADGATVRLRLPSDVSVIDSPSWESSEQVLVPVTPAKAASFVILRCSTETGRCELAARGQRSVALPGGEADNMSSLDLYK